MKRIMSFLLIFEGLLLLGLSPVALVNQEPVWPVVIPSLMALIFGALIYLFLGKSSGISTNKENISWIIFVWIVALLIGTIPYLLSKGFDSLTDILFETISGFTATGTSILPNPEILPKSILFWRSLTQWYGGILTISMLLLVFPKINIGGYKIFSLEDDRKHLITSVFIIYGLLTLAQVILLLAGGINLFKSFCISFATISTGCFLPDQTSVANYTPYLHFIMAGFMLLSGLGGLFYFKLFVLKKSNFRKHEEFRLYFYSFLIISVLFAWILSHTQSIQNRGEIFAKSIFQAASFLSSSGYEISEFRLWPHFFQPVLYLLILVGGCTNSSSGGIKLSRFIVLFRNIRTPFKNPSGDSEVSKISFNGKEIDEDTNLTILTFVSIFGFVLVLGTLVLTFVTNDLNTSVFLTITALSTFGHSMDLSGLPQAGKILISFLMLMGRLEILPFLALLIPSFYRNSPLSSEKLID